MLHTHNSPVIKNRRTDMKKSFAYLITVLVIASMLCACGMDEKDGVVGNSPRPSAAVDIIPSTEPNIVTSTPSAETSAKPDSAVKSPQVGESGTVTASPGADIDMKKK